MNNIFQLPMKGFDASSEEFFETLLQHDQIRIERILSCGQITPEGEWYDQEEAEWVVLIAGTAKLLMDQEGGEVIHLEQGDHLLIPARRKHRVIYTSKEPICIWLAVFFNAKQHD